MSSIDRAPSRFGRRSLLKAMALLGVGTVALGAHRAFDFSEEKNSKFVVVNGWVLPAQYFGGNLYD